MFLRNFCGPLALLNYTATIFSISGSSLSPNISSIIVAITQILGNFCSLLLVERLGRKLLFAISFFGCSLGLIVLGIFVYLKNINVEFVQSEGLQWIPLVCFSFVIWISNCGYMGITFLYIAEISPQNVKSYIASICLGISWILTFTIVKVSWILH
jgi:MFS family permease